MSNDLINTPFTGNTMSSREILDMLNTNREKPMLLGDLHRDIRDMFTEELGNGKTPSSLNPNGSVSFYLLPEIESKMLVASKDKTYLRQITEYWVNRGNQQQLSPMEMVIKSAQAIIKLEAEQAKQADDIAAIKDRQDKLDGDTKYMTALAYCREKGIPAPLKVANKLGRDCSRYCKQHGIEIGTVPDERWGSVNSYPVIILDGHLAI